LISKEAMHKAQPRRSPNMPHLPAITVLYLSTKIPQIKPPMVAPIPRDIIRYPASLSEGFG